MKPHTEGSDENADEEPLDLSGVDSPGRGRSHLRRLRRVCAGAWQSDYAILSAGSDGRTALYWHNDGAVWNNGGDTVVVATADGRTCSRERTGERLRSVAGSRSIRVRRVQASSESVVRRSADSIFDSAFRRCSSTVDGAQPSVSARSPWLTSLGMS